MREGSINYDILTSAQVSLAYREDIERYFLIIESDAGSKAIRIKPDGYESHSAFISYFENEVMDSLEAAIEKHLP